MMVVIILHPMEWKVKGRKSKIILNFKKNSCPIVKNKTVQIKTKNRENMNKVITKSVCTN